jgi:Family of unknown function (DUF6090)
MEKNKTGKYLKYAIGEIVLVVIGILIALSINNWNGERKSNQLEYSTLDALISELESNKISLQDCLDSIKEKRVYGDSIRIQLGPNKPTLSIDKMNDWFGEIGSTTRCGVSTDILEDVRSSGNLKIISSADIRRSIGKWTTNLQELQREEDDWAREFSTEFYPYTNKWISWDDVDKYNSGDDPRYFNSKFDFDPRLMLQEFEFSNVMAIHYWRMKRIEDRIEIFLKQTENALELMKAELKESQG